MSIPLNLRNFLLFYLLSKKKNNDNELQAKYTHVIHALIHRLKNLAILNAIFWFTIYKFWFLSYILWKRLTLQQNHTYL